jgi:hypothetical protein
VSVSRHHADWLSLVESSGPFLSLPVLLRAFPQGLDPREPEQAKQLRLAYEEWQENPGLAAKQRTWVMHVLTQVLLYPKELLAEGQTLPPGLTATMAEYGETLRPDLALVGSTGGELAGKSQLLISLYPVEQSLDKPVTGKHWKATPGTRMMELLHAHDVPLGLVTNGEEWMLVFAPRGDTTGFTSWYASLWIDEPITLRAFHSLLSTRRFFGVAPSDTLLALLKESAQDQQEVTNQLGDQVRDAVEVLIQAFDRLDQDSGRTLLKGLDEKSLYDAALTVMMRLVFLFSAEERGLLHLGEPLYDDNYAVSTLREHLQEVADHYGEEVLERRHDGWARLLASFRAVHGGVNHQDLMLPAYGGSLFDPDRYTFLEGRTQGTRWQSSPAAPLEINNRVVLHLLKSLQMLQVKVPGGGPAEALRISFEGLNIEQIGHVYEGLLDHTAVRAKEVVLGLAASRKKPVASITLPELEKLRQDDEAKLIELLEEETGRSGKALEKALNNGGEPEDFHKLLLACGQDKELAEKIIPFRGLLRQDSFERLVVVLPGGIYVGQGTARRSTGTHYTPRSLTEPIVQHTLEPLVYRGPAEGLTKEQWCLRSPKEILDLKVCDMAMGSGAFLVQACRYLSERLVEAWETLEKEHPGEVLITPEGGFSQGEPSERLIPKEAAERLAIARRLVADRCLYGIDINPMAVEMAKLSIWLITVDKSRPFTFLDHALKSGDSLLGVSSVKQIENFSLRPGDRQVTFATANLFRYVDEASAKRRELERVPSNNHGQIETKNRLHAEAEAATAKLKALADALIALELAGFDGEKYETQRTLAADEVETAMEDSLSELQGHARQKLGSRHPFHWGVEFPEIFQNGGFDAIVGNPPYLGAPKLTGTFGNDYREFLIDFIANGVKGLADLCAYFVLRTTAVVRENGLCGLVVTSAIAEGDTREVGLQQMTDRGWTVIRATSRAPWPGTANVTYSSIWLSPKQWTGEFFLNDERVSGVTPLLTAKQEVSGPPKRLKANLEKSFNGVKVYGDGFVITPDEAEALIAEDPRNKDVLYPYITTKDVNSDATHRPSAWAIRFFDWPLDRASAPGGYSGSVAADFPNCIAIVEARVKPERTRRDENGQFVVRDPMPQRWWIYGEKRPGLYSAISGLKHVLAVGTQATKYVAFAVLDKAMVFSHSLSIIADDSFATFAVLHSNLHEIWARHYGGYNLALLRYSPTDLFETFPFPSRLQDLEDLGCAYYEHRRSVMLTRQEGLTDTYNRFHDAKENAAEIQRLRALQVEVDQAVISAYGWNELDLGLGFHETKQGIRFTLSDAARRTVLDRLLALNHKRYDEEVESGLRQTKSNGARTKRAPRSSKVKGTSSQRSLY